MAAVSKAASGTAHGNTITLTTVKIYFQVFPGVKGTDAQRGIADVLYAIKTKDHYGVESTTWGKNMKTKVDGSVEISVPSDAPATLTIFDTDYLITALSALEASGTGLGRQRRLTLLGYEHGNINDPWGALADRAVLNYQADSYLNADGNLGTQTENNLVADFGE